MVIATTGMRGLLGEAGCRSAEEKATSPDSIHCHRQSFDQVTRLSSAPLYLHLPGLIQHRMGGLGIGVIRINLDSS